MRRSRFAPWRDRGLFASLPFGTDFTDEELVLAKALKGLAAHSESWSGRLSIARAMLSGESAPEWRPYLERMSLAAPASFQERLLQRQVLAALRLTRKDEAVGG